MPTTRSMKRFAAATNTKQSTRSEHLECKPETPQPPVNPIQKIETPHVDSAPTRLDLGRRSSRSSTRSQRRVAEAKERLAQAKLHEARAATALAEAEMERVQAESTDDDDLESTPDLNDKVTSKRVEGWLDAQPTAPATVTGDAAAAAATAAAAMPQPRGPFIDVATLAAALAQTNISNGRKPSKYVLDLPHFSGASSEWLMFKAAYRDTKVYFSQIENVLRLKTSLRGNAREAAQSLFIGEMEPDDIVKHLEVRFGRPDALVMAEIEKLRGLARPSDNPRDICIFSSRVNNIVAVIKSLDKSHYLYNPDTVRAVMDKMTTGLRYRWYDYANNHRDEPDLLNLASFLAREAELCCQFAVPEQLNRRDMSPPPKKPYRACAATYADRLETQQRPSKNQKQPPLAKEIEAIDSVSSRWEEAKRLNLCYRCLNKRGFRHRCSYRACGVDDCKGSHHPLLHGERSTDKPYQTDENKETATTPQAEVVTAARPHAIEKALLKVIPITVKGPTGAVDTYALLDEGSTITLVESDVAQAVGATGPVQPLDIEGIGGTQINASESMLISIQIKGKHSNMVHKVVARTIDRLHLSPQTIDRTMVEQCKHLKEVASDVVYERGLPTLLIGQDNWHIIVSKSVKSGTREQPAASLTELGWVLHGPCQGRAHRIHTVHRIEQTTNNGDERMEELMKTFFDLDNLGVLPRRPINDQEARALDILEKRSRRLPDGRFETGLLWHDEAITLPDNREATVRRFHSIERKLSKNPELEEQYKSQMQRLLDNDYAERATGPPTPGRTWYLPHFPVFNKSKSKPRIVLDAAARTQGLCLNDCLLSGPDLLQSLPGVLMRFRQKEVAVTADIQDMFLRIGIREEDRDALRFLWRNDQHQKGDAPVEFRMRSVIFGAASSPCTAIFIKNKNAEEQKATYPQAAEAIMRNHYMDDYCQSFDSIEEAKHVASSVDKVHRQAGLYLQKWASNRLDVIAAIAPQQMRQNKEVSINDGQTNEKTLGLVWKPQADVLAFNLNLTKVPTEIMNGLKRPTKREALRTIMSLFDPLGLVTPVIMPAKRLLQETWRLGVGWDDKLPVELHAAWCAWLGHVQHLRHLTVARCYPRASNASHLEMHIFVDASASSCAAAVYWRAVSGPAVHCSLAMAKGKVAPIKTTSIPRLELQAAVPGCRLARNVQNEHDLKPMRRVFWSDSRTVLAWLKAGPRVYKPFVAHRVAEVQEETNVCEWRWVPTALNVADDATRDTPSDFDGSHRWFRGPDFLYHPEETWPRDPRTGETTSPVTGEERVTTARSHPPRISDALPDVARFSSWLRLVRATARVMQFIELSRAGRGRATAAAGRMKRTRRHDDDPAWAAAPRRPAAVATPRPTPSDNKAKVHLITLEARHIQYAEKLWWRAAQAEDFGESLLRIRRHLPIERDSPLRDLSTYEDGEGILRLRPRINAAVELAQEQRSPPILHGEHAYTRLYIAWVHKQNHHSGTETVVNEIRSHLWVLRLRPITRTIVRSCVTCRKLRAKPAVPATGDHPSSRLAHHQRPFSYVGLDYFGPYSVTVGRRHEKRYVALFTCLTTRAVHLEVAGSLSTDSAIMALRRMMARRRCPTEIHSDNGTNLRGADAELKKAALMATQDETTIHAITWKYVPPGAPFMAGAWERMVQSVKRALAATLNERHPTEEVLTTLLIEAEYTVNNRPLTPVSVSPDDPEALTPLHFILGGPGRVPLPGSFSDDDLKTNQRWRHTQKLADIFWTRWVREYIPLLQYRREPTSRGRQPQIGDVVLLVDETAPRNSWAKGTITQTFPGRDGVVRVVGVATRTGVKRRATKKIVVLTGGGSTSVPPAGECARRT